MTTTRGSRASPGPILPDGVVDTTIGEQVGPQRLFLDLPVRTRKKRGRLSERRPTGLVFSPHQDLTLGSPNQHGSDFVGLWEKVPHFAVHLLTDDKTVAGLPVAHLHGLGGSDHMFPHGLRGA